MRTLNVYTTYSFKTKDPVIDELRTMLKDSGKKASAVAKAANLSPGTPKGWFQGGVRRPQSASVEAFGRALGYERIWFKMKKGR